MAEILCSGQTEETFFVSVRQFLVVRGQNINRLAVRLYNGLPRIVTAVRLRAVCLNECADKGECRTFDVERVSGKPGEVFLLPDLALPAAWRQVEVRVEHVCSRQYVYALAPDGGICVRLGGRAAPPHAAKRRRTDAVVRSGRGSAVRLTALIFALAAVALAVLFPFMQGDFREAETVEREYVEIQEYHR